MRVVVCNKCGKSDVGRKPTGYHDVINPECNGYYDFCPTCYEEYTRVREAAENTKKATIAAWLSEVVPKKEISVGDIFDSIPENEKQKIYADIFSASLSPGEVPDISNN